MFLLQAHESLIPFQAVKYTLILDTLKDLLHANQNYKRSYKFNCVSHNNHRYYTDTKSGILFPTEKFKYSFTPFNLSWHIVFMTGHFHEIKLVIIIYFNLI